jgi:hypothetical protein
MDGTDVWTEPTTPAQRRAGPSVFFIVCSALGGGNAARGGVHAIRKCKDLHSHRKQAFGAARMPITRKCQGRRGILPECLLQLAAGATILDDLPD